jgi:hypothetical protein
VVGAGVCALEAKLAEVVTGKKIDIVIHSTWIYMFDARKLQDEYLPRLGAVAHIQLTNRHIEIRVSPVVAICERIASRGFSDRWLVSASGQRESVTSQPGFRFHRTDDSCHSDGKGRKAGVSARTLVWRVERDRGQWGRGFHGPALCEWFVRLKPAD